MMNLPITKYIEQKLNWPASGRHILAQYNDETIVVYQAYRPSIAEYAVTHGRFGGDFSFNRMSWIKPNFLWMMYRSGWASKEGQERVLAIRMERSGFDEICRQAIASSFGSSGFEDRADWQDAVTASDVRLQWDPDDDPQGNPVHRRAVQLGLRGNMLRSYSDRWIREITDITEFVHEQKNLLDRDGVGALLTPVEKVYPTPESIGVDGSIGLPEEIKYVIGDATMPSGTGPNVLVHVCNDSGGWGRGFVLAVSSRWQEPERAYRDWFNSDVTKTFRLGAVQFVSVDESFWVANMIGQHKTKPIDDVPPVRYPAIRECLQQVREFAVLNKASVHMPRIGCGLAGGSWKKIEAIVRDELSERGIRVTVYDLPDELNSIGWKA